MAAAPALVELSVLAILWVCLALATLIVGIIAAVEGVFNVLPWPLNKIGGAIGSVTGPITNALGKAEAGIDAAIGASWHALAWFLRESWHEIENAALAYLGLAELVLKLVYVHSGLRALLHHNDHAIGAIRPRVGTLEREYKGIDARLRDLRHDLSHGIGHDLRIGLRDLTKEVHGIETATIPAIQSDVGAVEGELTSLKRFIGALPGVKYLDWAAGIVAAAVGIDIINSLRCPSFLKSVRSRKCGLWDGIEDVLGLFFDVALFGAFCDLWAEATPIFQEILDPLVGFAATFADGACSHPPSSFTELSVAAVTVPPSLQQIGSTP